MPTARESDGSRRREFGSTRPLSGITKRGATIDLCKEAAEQLEMISEGMARVRTEELPDDKGADAAPDSKATAARP